MKVVKNKEDYRKMEAEFLRLLNLDPQSGTPDADRLELIAFLLESYERSYFPIERPDPISAILFRMEEQALLQKDLIPYIGSKGKVSEVLSRKRPLTLKMIRSLSVALDIPFEILISDVDEQESQGLDHLEGYPIAEMKRRGWLSKSLTKFAGDAKKAAKDFLSTTPRSLLGAVHYRRSSRRDTATSTKRARTLAWLAQVHRRSEEEDPRLTYVKGTITKDFLWEVARLSCLEHGPIIAIDYLRRSGISVIVEPQLRGSGIDGASFVRGDGTPVIGLTIRYNRLDSFWFTLMHELAHVFLHLFRSHQQVFIDDMDIGSAGDDVEKEADRAAEDALIPRVGWRSSEAFRQQTSESVVEFAKKARVHPAVVAGRIRRETGNYSLLSDLVGQREVRKEFPDITW